MIVTKLWEHQRQMHDFVLAQLKDLGYAFLHAGCAVGKTLTMYQVFDTLGLKMVLVLTTRAAITSAWLEDARIHTADIDILPLVKGNSTQKAKQIETAAANLKKPLVVVVNYETARLIKETLYRTPFDMVVSDESHKLASHNSLQSVDLALSCSHIPYKVIMTGTGWDDRHHSLFGQVRFLSCYKGHKYKGKDTAHSGILGRWSDFYDRYTEYYTLDNNKIPIKPKNLDELREKINPFTFYVDSEKVLTLPPELHINRMVPMEGVLLKAYKDMEDEAVMMIDGEAITADNVLVQALRLHQLTGGYYKPSMPGEPLRYIGSGGDAKLNELLAVMDEIGGKPSVVFTRFTSDVQTIEAALQKQGIETRLLVGGTHQHDEWQTQKQGQVLIANISAGAAGINLTRARYCIYYSIGHSRTDYNQSRYRVRRPGSDLNFPITYYHILMENSIDVDIRRAMEEKANMAELLVRGLTNRVRSTILTEDKIKNMVMSTEAV